MEKNLRGLCWLFLGIVYRSSTPNFRQKVSEWNRNLQVLDEDFENMVPGRSVDPQFPIDLSFFYEINKTQTLIRFLNQKMSEKKFNKTF